MISKIKKLNRIFNPRTIALIGAIDRPGSVGLGLCKNLLEGEMAREIFFVNPYYKKVLGKNTYPFVTSITKPVDLAIIAVPSEIVPRVIKECCEKGVGGIIIISSGFAETGESGKKLQEEVLGLTKEANILLIGPNCLGVIRPFIKLNASFAPATPKAGEIAFVSQSGALIDSVVDRSLLENYGFSNLISYGNEADLQLSDFLEWLEKDEKTKVIGVYLEAIKDGKRFMQVARKISKPIVILKAGKTKSGAQAVSTHTAALAGTWEVYSAVFKQLGMIEVETTEELFDALKALAWQPKCKGGVGIVTNGGGYGVLIADFCEKFGIELPELKPEILKRLESSKAMHPAFSRKNPLDIVGDALPERYDVALDTLLSQKEIGGLIVVQTFQIMTDTISDAKVIIKAKAKYPQKPILCMFVGGKFTNPGIELLEKNKIPNYSDPKRTVLAMKMLVNY